jgi:DNA-binding protein H-NS
MPSYSDLISQIEDLKKQAERTRKEEFSSVIKTIKKQIADYGITAADLGLSAKPAASKRGGKKAAATKPGRKPRARSASKGAKVAPKYRDELGNTWTRRGKMPKWLAAAMAQGRALDSFKI